MVKNAQEWLNNLNLDKNTATSINLHKTTLGNSTILTQDCEDLIGEIVIEDFVKLTEINFERHQKSTTLISGGTIDGSITKITIKNCPNLEEINLDKNKITDIIFEGTFDKLVRLDVNNNLLTKIDLSKFPNLRSLDLFVNKSLDGRNIRGIENFTKIQFVNVREVQGGGFNGEYLREWRDEIKGILGIPTTNPLPDTWKNDLKAKLDDLKNQANQKALEDKVKNLLGISANDSLPADWEKQLAKKADLDNANAKVNQLINIIEKQNDAIKKFGDKLDDYKPEVRREWQAEIVDVSKFKI